MKSNISTPLITLFTRWRASSILRPLRGSKNIPESPPYENNGLSRMPQHWGRRLEPSLALVRTLKAQHESSRGCNHADHVTRPPAFYGNAINTNSARSIGIQKAKSKPQRDSERDSLLPLNPTYRLSFGAGPTFQQEATNQAC